MIPIVDDHRCTKRHRSAAAFLRCRQPGIEVVGTGGPLALLISCSETPRAVLVQRLEHARTLTAEYDVFGCSPTCTRDHELIGIDLDSPAVPAFLAQRPNRPTTEAR